MLPDWGSQLGSNKRKQKHTRVGAHNFRHSRPCSPNCNKKRHPHEKRLVAVNKDTCNDPDVLRWGKLKAESFVLKAVSRGIR